MYNKGSSFGFEQIPAMIENRSLQTLVPRPSLLEVYQTTTKHYGRADARLSLLLNQIHLIRNLAATENKTIFGSTPPLNNKVSANIGKAFFSFSYASI